MAKNRDAYKPKPPFKAVEGLGTEPWMRLSRNGAYVLDRFYANFTGRNRSNIELSYGKMKDKMSNRPFANAIWEVIGYGFIDIVKDGGLKKEPSVYRISDRWRKLVDHPGKLNEIQAM